MYVTKSGRLKVIAGLLWTLQPLNRSFVYLNSLCLILPDPKLPEELQDLTWGDPKQVLWSRKVPPRPPFGRKSRLKAYLYSAFNLDFRLESNSYLAALAKPLTSKKDGD